MGGATDDNGNGRITLAVLGEKLDTIIKRLDNYDRRCEDQDRRMNALEIGQAQRQTQIVNLSDDVKTLKAKSDAWNAGNSILGAAASLLALFK